MSTKVKNMKDESVHKRGRKSKYISVIPKKPTGLNAYQLFIKDKFSTDDINDDGKPAADRLGKLGEMWRNLPSDEIEKYKLESDKVKAEAQQEWARKDTEREEMRRKLCMQLNIPESSSWEEVDTANRKIWEKENGISSTASRVVKKSSKRGDTKDIDFDDEESSDDEIQSAVRNEDGVKSKKRRHATEQAYVKMKEQRSGLSDDSDEDSDSSDVGYKKKKLKKANSSSNLLSSMGVGGGIGHSSEGKALRKRSSRLGDVEWATSTWGQERVKAVSKAIDRVYEMALDADNFNYFGNDMIQCFYDVATVTGEPIRSKTLKYVEHLANRWKYTTMQDGWKDDEDGNPTPSEVMEVVTGMYCMERVGIRHDLKSEVLQFLQSKAAYSAEEYFGWDPKQGAISDSGGIEVSSNTEVSKYRLMSTSLIHSFYADRVGLVLGCDYVDLFKWLPVLRPYKGPHELPWDEYIDQCYLVTHIVFTMNNWGELRLDASLFPHEYYFLRNHLEVHIQQRDVHLTAEFVESLRCFGCGDDDALIRKGMRALLALQTESGVWDPTEDDPYRTYHATMCGAQALLAHRFRGFGPGIPSVLPYLLRWAHDDAAKKSDYNTLSADMKESVCALSKRVNAARVAEFGDVVKSVGSIHNPTDMASHTEERLASFKQAIRSLAKSAAASGLSQSARSVAVAPIVSTSSVTTSKSECDDGGIDSENGLLLDQLQEPLNRYVHFVNSSDSVNFTDSDSDELLSLLKRATDVPVTASVLKSGRYMGIPKNIRTAAKGKGLSSRINSEILQAASLLMATWKESVLAAGNTSPRATSTTASNEISSAVQSGIHSNTEESGRSGADDKNETIEGQVENGEMEIES